METTHQIYSKLKTLIGNQPGLTRADRIAVIDQLHQILRDETSNYAEVDETCRAILAKLYPEWRPPKHAPIIPPN